MAAAEHIQQELEQKCRRLQARLCSRRKAGFFGAWRLAARFDASTRRLGAVLGPCMAEFEQPAHERSGTGIAAVVQLLKGLHLYEGLCAEAQQFVAQHAQLVVLHQGSELHGGPCDEADVPKAYSVVSGSVMLLHGNPSDTDLQAMLHTARLDWQEEVKAAAELYKQQALCRQASDTAAAASQTAYQEAGCANCNRQSIAAQQGLDTAEAAPSNESSLLGVVEAAMLHKPCHRGVWQRVIASVSHCYRQQLHSTLNATGSTATVAGAAPQQHTAVLQQQQQQQQCRALPWMQAGTSNAPASGATEAGSQLETPSANHDSRLSVSMAGTGQSFCVSKFACTSPSADGMLFAGKLPTPCVAAVAAPSSVAAVLTVSKPVFLQALRLHQEHQLSSTLALLCRVPAMQHAPLKELTRLATHLKETTYTPGSTILRQGQEVSDIHFVLQGAVHLTYSAAVAQAACRAATRASFCGGQAPTGPLDNVYGTGAAATAAAAASGGRFSGLAQALRLEQTSFDPPVVLATRGPGAVLGDDAVRDRCLMVGVVAAAEGAVTLRVPPQKFLALLDPLTLRLFSWLRQDSTLQDALVAAAAAAHLAAGPGQPQHAEAHRLALLHDVYSNNIPRTLLRQGDEQGAAAGACPPWHSLRGRPSPEGPSSVHTAGRQLRQPPTELAGAGGSGSPQGAGDQPTWEAQLPAGLTAAKCVGLPQTASVKELVELIKDVSEYRRLHTRVASISAAAVTAYAATAAARATSASLAGSVGINLLSAHPRAQPTSAVSPAATTAAAAAAAMAAQCSSSSRHTELLESCCVAILRVVSLPGQAPVGAAALSGVFDDMYSACGAIAYDEGLQAVRWGPGSLILIAPMDPGGQESAGVECAADVLLTAAARFAGIMLRADGHLPLMRLAVGLAQGSCFVDREAGNFVTAVSGRAFDAAEQLCTAAVSKPTWALSLAPATSSPSSSSSSSNCVASPVQAVLCVSDGVAVSLQAGSGYSLQAEAGCHLLLAARAALPCPSVSSSSRQQQPQTSRVTLGPGRHTILGLGLAAGLPPTTPKTPTTSRRRAGSTFGGAKVHMRRQIRRKFEAMASFLAGAGDTLPPPPDSMLTQPPPPAAAAAAAAAWAPGELGGAGAGAAAAGVGRARAVNFAVCEQTGSGSTGCGRLKPKLSISLDGTGVADADEGSAAAGSSKQRGRLLLTASTPNASCAAATAAAARLEGSADKHAPPASRGASAEAVQQQQQHQPAAGRSSNSRQGSASGTAHGQQAAQLSGSWKLPASCTAARHNSTAGRAASASTAAAPATRDASRHSNAISSSCGRQVPAGACQQHPTASGSISSAGGSSCLRLRQQVWHEVQALRAAGEAASLPGCVAAALAAAHCSAAGLSMAGRWGGTRRGSASYWGPASTPPRPASPSTTFLLISPSSSRPTSPHVQPAAAHQPSMIGQLAAGTVEHSQTRGAGPVASSDNSNGSGIFKWGSGVSLISLTGSMTVNRPLGDCVPVGGANSGIASCSRPVRSNTEGDKVVCFLTPRTQAAQAQHMWQGIAPAMPIVLASQAAAAAQLGLQVTTETDRHPQRCSSSAMHASSSSGGCSAGGPSGCGRDSAAMLPHQLVQGQQLTQEQQQWLVHAACKALGSAAAAAAYVAALPESQEVINMSAAGLVQLPSLHNLDQLETLAASFNKLSGLTGLVPANEAAIAAAATAAATTVAAEHGMRAEHKSTSAANSRPGTASSVAGRSSRPASAQSLDACGSTAVFEGAYQQHLLQLQQLSASPTPSTLPASLLNLQLSHNQLATLPAELPAALPALTHLDVSHNRLQDLPASIGALRSLRCLLVAHNQLQRLPHSVTLLQQLHTLHADHNSMMQLPEGLQDLSSLVSLHLQSNQLQQLPAGLQQLTRLTSLGLGANNLQQLPHGMLLQLSSLRQLDVSGNGLDDAALQQAAAVGALSSSAGARAAGQAAAGSASRPASPAGLPLQTSSAAHEGDASAWRSQSPDSDQAPQPVLPGLLALDVSHNRLQQLPSWLPSSLVWLSAGHNRITQLQPALCRQLCGSLQGLELSHNLLEMLPDEVRSLSKLQLLCLAGNPGLHPDLVEAGGGLSGVYRWLAEQKQASAAAVLKDNQLHMYKQPAGSHRVCT